MVSPVLENTEFVSTFKEHRRDSGAPSELSQSGRGWSCSSRSEDQKPFSNLFWNNDEDLSDCDQFDTIDHSGRVTKIFNPMRYVLTIVGRFPFRPSVTRITKTEVSEGPLGVQSFSPSLKSPTWLYFGLSSLFLVYMLCVSITSFLGVFLEWNIVSKPEWTSNQIHVFESNLIPFVLVWSCLLSAVVGSFSFFLNRKKVTTFLNFWNAAVDEMGVDLPKSLTYFLHLSNLWFLLFVIITVVSSTVLDIKIARGGSDLLGMLAIRPFVPHILIHTDELHQHEWGVRIVGLFVMLYAMYSSRALLFFFIFQCRLLRHCFKRWNRRLFIALTAGSKSDGYDSIMEASTCSKLFNDWRTLLKLIHLTDEVFSAVLLSYYGSQILNMCFELYYVAMSNTVTLFNRDGDGWDTFVAILLLIQNIYVFLSVSLHGASVGQEAQKAYEILKCNGLSSSDSSSKRCLIQSLQLNFQHRISLTGGQYFDIDKPFIVSVLGAVFTYFIIIVQYGQHVPSR